MKLLRSLTRFEAVWYAIAALGTAAVIWGGLEAGDAINTWADHLPVQP